MLRPEARPSSPSSATITTGRPLRSTMREATIPITPGCQPSPESTYASRSPSSAIWASAWWRIARSTSLALAVGRVELVRHLAGAAGVLGQQQLERRVGAVQPPGGVQPRRQRERHRPLSRLPGRHAGDLHQRPQPGPRGGLQAAQAAHGQRAVLAQQRDHVGDRRQRHQVELGLELGRVASAGHVQRLRELVGDRRGAQLAAGVAAHAGVHDRGPRQHSVGARGVVVADHDLEPQRERGLDLLHRAPRRSPRSPAARSRARPGARSSPALSP